MSQRCERDTTLEASTSNKLPIIYHKRTSVESLKGRLQRQARLRLLGLKNSLILDNTKLEQIWYILRQYVGISSETLDRDRLNYDEFCQAAAACQEVFGAAVDSYFKPSVFLRLQRDTHGTVSLLSLFNYFMRRNAMLQTRVHLSCFDEIGRGFLTEEQLQSYITQLVPELPALSGLDSHLDLQTYSKIAVRKFCLLHGKNGRCKAGGRKSDPAFRMKIKELLPSLSLAELLEMRLPPASENGEPSASNWFGLPSAVKLATQFSALDVDGKGRLSELDFAGFSSGTMTSLFITRIFEEHAAVKQSSADGDAVGARKGMDFTSFVDFSLAWDHRSTPPGIRYFFPVLDMNGRGYITQVELFAFLKEIYAMWVACGQYKELSIEDVKDEIIDIIQPTDPFKITIKDLIDCGMAGTVISILADVNLFWEYDMRETLLQPEEAEDTTGLTCQ